MLDSVTKKRIDDLRNILVGKIPSPQSQVEQITTGLIYKFMYDMDNEAIDMGGVPSFFVDEFERYSWKNLFNPKLGGVEKVKLYSDAIENLYNNPHAPSIFRQIFKNSFLPFKDPSTLNMFLKEINEFHYSNSEKLGDAYEYLLSFMGSQGDAGQFRTPRHIINFIIEIVNPKKNETILDPACGTAGFLISAYKHILTQNTQTRIGDELNAAERKQIGENLVGYDIDPAMSRISLVNMYLHNFSRPNISEYDTISSEDKWNEYFDVILANPPFFSPTGGIKPHSRFGVQSTRAEVLFVDYIIEHLKPNGRAGIIVPEGVIFKKDNAYKSIRKKLISDSLVGIISLPQGVFNPYSPVKTSILILDKQVNKKYDEIYFYKVENDGFTLGSQRNISEKNDLPLILEDIKNGIIESQNKTWIKKSEILSNKICSFSINIYLKEKKINSKYERVSVIDLFDVITPPNKIKSKDFLESGKFPIIDQSNDYISGFWDNSKDCVEIEKPVIIFGDHTKNVKYIDFNFVAGADGIKILSPKNIILPEFLFYNLRFLKLPELGYSRYFKELKLKKITLPPISLQKKIIDEIKGYQSVIDGCKKVVENYKPNIEYKKSWEMIEIGEIFENKTETMTPEEIMIKNPQYIGLEHIGKGTGLLIDDFKNESNQIKSHKTKFKRGDILYGKLRPNLNKVVIAEFDGICSTDILVLRKLENDENIFFHAIFLANHFNEKVVKSISGSQLPRTNFNFIKNIKVPRPSLEDQKFISVNLNAEKSIVQGNKLLIENFNKKILNIFEDLNKNKFFLD